MNGSIRESDDQTSVERQVHMDYTIERKALYEIIADRMEEMILSDTTKISQKLPSEQQLADSFGVSRPVIREALKILKERGLISSRQGASSVITDYDTDAFIKSINRITCMKNVSPAQIYQIRTVLEVLSAKLAAENPDKSRLNALKERNRTMEDRWLSREGSEEAIKERARLDAEFHSAVAGMSGNPLLHYMTEALSSLLIPVIEKTICDETAKDGISFHDRIIAAIESGDVDKASALMRDHLMLSIRNYEFMNPENIF